VLDDEWCRFQPKVLGWTADGAVVCEVSSHSAIAPPPPEEMESAEDAPDRYVVVLRDDKETNRWRVGSAYPKFVKSPPADEREAWKATVEPISWEAPQHIVVALGATAAREGVRAGAGMRIGSNRAVPPRGWGRIEQSARHRSNVPQIIGVLSLRFGADERRSALSARFTPILIARVLDSPRS